MIINIIILVLILAGLTIHRYLTFFYEERILPYSMGFLTFVNLFLFFCLINFVWMFGFLMGVIIFLLSFFQIIYSSYLWPFLLPWLARIHRRPVRPRVNLIIYGVWSLIVIGTGLLGILNFFISDYGSFLRDVIEIFNNNIRLFGILLIGSMIIGNIIRIGIMKNIKKFTKARTQFPKEVKEALKMLNKMERSFDNAGFHLVRNHIEKMILAQPNKFVDIIQRGTSLRVWIFTAVANTAGDFLESGNYHIYRGVLNPMGPGNDLLRLFDAAVDELVKIGVLKPEKAKEEKEAIRENIKSVG